MWDVRATYLGNLKYSINMILLVCKSGNKVLEIVSVSGSEYLRSNFLENPTKSFFCMPLKGSRSVVIFFNIFYQFIVQFNFSLFWLTRDFSISRNIELFPFVYVQAQNQILILMFLMRCSCRLLVLDLWCNTLCINYTYMKH